MGAISSVLRNSGLKHLNLSNWPFDDLEALALMTRLTKLLLTSKKLVSLRGIDALISLKWLDLHACQRLKSIEGIQACQSISRLEITSCKAVHDISELGELGALVELHLDDGGEIESLDPLQRCTLLEKLSFFGGTRIRDGKISAIEGLPRLKTLCFAPRRHYDRTRDAVRGLNEPVRRSPLDGLGRAGRLRLEPFPDEPGGAADRD
jgi:Leucine-rich repeat (LRR) protein